MANERKSRLGPGGTPRPWWHREWLRYTVEEQETFVPGAVATEAFFGGITAGDWCVSGQTECEVFITCGQTGQLYQPGEVAALVHSGEFAIADSFTGAAQTAGTYQAGEKLGEVYHAGSEKDDSFMSGESETESFSAGEEETDA